MSHIITAVFKNGPKWDPTVHPTILDFVTSFPEHDASRVEAINDFMNTLVGVVTEARPADPAKGDDDTVSWVNTYTVMDNYNKDPLVTVALLLEHLETRKTGPFMIAHGYTLEVTTVEA
jgi:hypothetical protein